MDRNRTFWSTALITAISLYLPGILCYHCFLLHLQPGKEIMDISTVSRGLRNTWPCADEKISGVVEGLGEDNTNLPPKITPFLILSQRCHPISGVVGLPVTQAGQVTAFTWPWRLAHVLVSWHGHIKAAQTGRPQHRKLTSHSLIVPRSRCHQS